MHREQSKCRLRTPPTVLVSRTETARPEDFSAFSANLHSARIVLLPYLIWDAVVEGSRFLKRGLVKTRKDNR